MMENNSSNEPENAVRKVTVRFTLSEYERLNKAFQQTTERKLSQYVRAVLLEKPVTVYTRSKSIDAFVFEMVLLRSELSAIGNNFNQAVKRLHTLSYLSDIQTWTGETERIHTALLQKTTQIDERIAQISDTWLHESAQ